MFAPHKNMMRKTNNGVMVQNHSRGLLPVMRGVRSSSARRWYLKAKKSTNPAISTAMVPQTAQRKKNSASTRWAVVEACSGNKGTSANIVVILIQGLVASRRERVGWILLRGVANFPPLTPPHRKQRQTQDKHGDDSSSTHQVQRCHGIFACFRIVTVAI